MGVTDAIRFRSLGGAVLLHLQPFARSGLSSTIMLRMLGQIHTCRDPPDHKTSKRMLYECLREGAERAPDSTNHLATGDNSNSHTSAPSPQAFPTEAKEKERENRNRIKAAEGTIVVKKRKQVVENHYDDCGDDLSSLD